MRGELATPFSAHADTTRAPGTGHFCAGQALVGPITGFASAMQLLVQHLPTLARDIELGNAIRHKRVCLRCKKFGILHRKPCLFDLP